MNRSRFQSYVVLSVSLLCLASAVIHARTWTSKTGKFRVEASFVAFSRGVVVLRRDDSGKQIRVQLAATMVAVISQALLPRLDTKGRIAAFEIMIATPAIRNLIREGKTYQVISEIQTGHRFGMTALDDQLKTFYDTGIISYDTMIETAQDPKALAELATKPRQSAGKK